MSLGTGARTQPDGVTAKVARYIEGMQFDRLPAEVVVKAQAIILDQLACQLACSSLAHGRIATEYARRQGARGDATVIGSDLKTSAEHAALVNGILGHGDEIDGSLPGFGHACAVLLPAALALGERERASGRDLIVGLVVGYDVARRLAKAGLSLDTLAPRNFHQGSVAGSIAAAATAGKMLQLDQRALQAAFGLAADQSCGLQAIRTEDEHMNKSFHMGVASRNGVASADLARLGYGGVMNVFDAPYSVFEAFAPDDAAPEELALELGERFDILAGRFKRYAAGSPMHSAIASTLAILDQEALVAGDIESIVVKMPTLERRLLSDRNTKNINAEYIVAVAALDGRVAWDQYEEGRQRDPLLIDLWNRVTTVGDPEMDAIKTADYLARPAEVVLRTGDGRTFTHRMIYPPGSPKNPLSGEELDEKFMFWSTLVISDEQASRLKSAVARLDAMDDVNELGELLRVSQRVDPSDRAH